MCFDGAILHRSNETRFHRSETSGREREFLLSLAWCVTGMVCVRVCVCVLALVMIPEHGELSTSRLTTGLESHSPARVSYYHITSLGKPKGNRSTKRPEETLASDTYSNSKQ